jgi:2-(1,2-epoxy-1,2-dihydrophenyl)acetyl-CoA isomerase
VQFETIQLDHEDQVATVTLNRPDQKNAMTHVMREELVQAIRANESDNSVRVVIVTGAGEAFCAGGDLNEKRRASEAGEGNPLSNKISPIRDKISLGIRGSSKPYIAAVNGAAAGGGMDLTLACDIRIASTAAKFSNSFSRIGLHPDWGSTYFLPRLVGVANACELIWSGSVVEATRARDIGLVSHLVEPDKLADESMRLARSLLRGAPIAIQLSKRSIYRNLSRSLEEALEFETLNQNVCVDTDDAKEGVHAFLEKRRPQFKGR